MKDAYKAPRFKVGDTIRVYNKSGEPYLKTIKEVRSSWYIFTDGKRYNLGGQDGWELVPETDFGKNELTEFEKELVEIIGFSISKSAITPNVSIIEFAKQYSDKLLSIARKQIASEIDVDNAARKYHEECGLYGYGVEMARCSADGYKKGMLAALKAIKGE